MFVFMHQPASFMFINKHCKQVSDAIGRAAQAKEGPDSVWLGDCTKCLYNYLMTYLQLKRKINQFAGISPISR